MAGHPQDGFRNAAGLAKDQENSLAPGRSDGRPSLHKEPELQSDFKGVIIFELQDTLNLYVIESPEIPAEGPAP